MKCRIEGDIKKLRQDVNVLTGDLKGELGSKKKQKMKELFEKHRVKKKGLKTVIEELKQRMLAKSAKVKRYEQRIKTSLDRTGFLTSTKRRSTQN